MAAEILPSPNIDPAAAVAWYLTNPLLLAAYPEGIARRVREVANGEFTGPKLHKLAVDLYTARKQLRIQSRVEPGAAEAEKDLRLLLQSRYLSDAERKDLSYWIHTSRPSEYAWLRKPIESAIQARGEAALLVAAAKVSKATNTKIIRASELSAAA